jgi:mRNA-degrading endonuclease RelE of RelBE toxin-antitoxin system
MSRPRREVTIAPAAFEQMLRAKPTDDERDAIRNVLHDLGGDPLLGYKVPFLHPPLYRIDTGRFRIHYRFDEHEVRVEFVGVY